MHTLPQKNRISFPVGFVSQLPSVSPVLQRESNVSSFVFPVQCCQILFQLSEKCVWWHTISASALGAAVAPPLAPCLPPTPLLLVQGSGLIVLWVKRLVPHTTAHVPHPSIFPPHPPGPCCSGYATVFSSAHCGFTLLHWWWVEDLTCSTFRLPCAKQQPLYCLHILLSVSVHLYILLDRLLEIPGNIFLPPVFLLEAACALPWCSLHISFWLFWDFSSPNRLPRTCFSVLGLSLLCVHFQLVKILLRSGIHLWLDLTQPLVH